MALISSSSPNAHGHHHHHLGYLDTATIDYRQSRQHHLGHAAAAAVPRSSFKPPSSPTAGYYNDGDISPTFDSSFASSMSFNSDPAVQPSQPPQSSPVLMDISPAPATTRYTTLPQPPSAPAFPPLSAAQPRAAAEYPYLKQLFNSRTRQEPSSTGPAQANNWPASHSEPPTPLLEFPPVAPLSIKSRQHTLATASSRPHLTHYSSAPTVIPGDGSTASASLRPPMARSSLLSRSAEDLVHVEDDTREESDDEEAEAEEEGPMHPPAAPSSRSRSPLPAGWNKPPARSRHTMPVPPTTLAPPPALHKHRSAPAVPKCEEPESLPESSPYRMDIDGASPDDRLSSPVSVRPHSHPRSVSDSGRKKDENPFFVSSASPVRGLLQQDQAPGSGASDRLGDIFNDDLSPIPQSRKRFLDEHQSPTPGSPTPLTVTASTASLFSAIAPSVMNKPSRRPFEKAMSTTAVPMSSAQSGVIRRQRSSTQLRKRTSSSNLSHHQHASSLSSASSCSVGGSKFIPPVPTMPHSIIAAANANAAAINKRHAVACAGGKPKTMRRAYSVADAAVPLARPSLVTTAGASAAAGSTTAGNSSRNSFPAGGPSPGQSEDHVMGNVSGNRASIATEPSSYVSFAHTHGRDAAPSSKRASAMAPVPERERPSRALESSSPITGFRRNLEAKGKALPCFGVKEDGLMRISAATLNDVQAGVYSAGIARYLIIDCRFDYEYQGGHITDAVNLSEMVDVEKALLGGDHLQLGGLGLGELPLPSTSEDSPVEGKTVLIFHCEFSAKRAPTTAKHLRNQDRLKCHNVYPNVHYPELYVLQGGYAEFYRQFPQRCVGGYLAMDDPARLAERSLNLNAFRAAVGNQKRQFTRANTFTFGQAQHASTILRAAGAAGVVDGMGMEMESSRQQQQPRPSSMAARMTGLAVGGARKPLISRNTFQADGGDDGFDRGFSFPAIKKKTSLSTATTKSATDDHDHDDEDEENDRYSAADSSFGSSTNDAAGSSPCGPGRGGAAAGGDSPCPPTSKTGGGGGLRNPFRMAKGQGMMLGSAASGTGGRRVLERAQTSGVLMFTR